MKAKYALVPLKGVLNICDISSSWLKYEIVGVEGRIGRVYGSFVSENVVRRSGLVFERLTLESEEKWPQKISISKV